MRNYRMSIKHSAGLAVDHANRRLYYTNVGSVTVDYKEYSWHKIETVRLDSLPVKVRTIVSSHADRPRAIAIDSTNGYSLALLTILWAQVITVPHRIICM